jgi:serine/threonine protein kinase
MGTPYYMAPEVCDENYGKECDIWSLGACLFQVLTGRLPFEAETAQELFPKIKSGVIKLPKHLSSECQDIIRKMLTVDPNKRITAAEAASHPWIVANKKKEVEVSPEEQ